MANKTASMEGGAAGTLQRGKACLRCRKRKMRCDGAKPACQQCTRAKKADACEYDDGKGKTRTQILRDTITRLEQRIRELEDPEYISPAVTLYDPHSYPQDSSPASSFGSPGSTSISASHSPFPSEHTHSPQGSWSHLPGVSSSPVPFSTDLQVTDIFFSDPNPQTQPPQYQSPFELEPVLLDIFAPHSHQSGLAVHMGHLRDSLNLPLAEQRHPALMNAIYLWACFVSRPEALCQHEEHFLSQALDALREGLRLGDKVVDVIQASCLLSTYFLANGRILEGSYHSSAAAALAVQCGLHSREAKSWMSDELMEEKPHKSDYREGERVLAFWQVYNLDRCWSVALRKPVIIPDGPDAWHSINCPWPQDMSEYETGHLNPNTFRTVRSFLEGEVSSTGFSTQALRAKASALFSQANQLSSTWESPMKQSTTTQEQMQALELTITRFIPTLIPVHQLEATTLEEKYLLFVTHNLAHAAIIHLYQRFAQDDPVAYDKCSRAARAIVSSIKHINGQDFDFLDPVIGLCWSSASDTLIRELNAIESSWPLMSSTEVRDEISTLLYAMTSLNRRFPILGVAATKIQKRLADL